MAQEQDQKKEITEVKAFARGVHISPRKVRLVVDTVRKLPVGEALVQLEFLTKKATVPVKKLLRSAIANASHNFAISEERLYVKNFSVDGGRVFVRYEPRAQGRAFVVRKRTSNLNLILGVSSKPLKTKIRELKPLAKKEPISEPEIRGNAPEEVIKPAGKRSFAFWRKKPKGGQTEGVAPKAGSSGKRYTGFDRRGGDT